MKILLLTLALISSAFAQNNPDLPDPGMLTKKYLDEISKREIGQTRFAKKWGGEDEQTQQQGREIQESDLFKLGNQGKKELFLLNNYRGFQVISFADGLDKPKIVGRLPLYNNWSSEMYYLEEEERVMVVNTEYTYSRNNWEANYKTKVYLIDVSDSTSPKIINDVEEQGYLSQSRLVGDVLYILTESQSESNQAYITSYKLNKDKLEYANTVALHGDNRWVRTMNVVKEGKKYFVISTLSNWGNEGDLVNVHDISSTTGEIEKVFTAQARGSLSERSQTFFHKDHLFMVSNYLPSTGARMRISVEAVPNKKNARVVTSAENMRLSIGDTNGQHASLQDVRVSGDLLYTFWVPANNIDPFDLIDISNPEGGLKHLGQLQFDGWISRAFPLNMGDRKFVLGLGWIVSPTDEEGKRYPQAKLFEVKSVDGTYKHEVVTSLTLDSDEVWAQMNDEDRSFEVIQEAAGIYNIMFPVTFRKNWKDGAKVVTLDLNAGALKEGASLIGEQGWLRRVFLNRELSTVHAFGDLALETYNQSDLPVNGVAKTVSILELARNIIDFYPLNRTVGVQLVRSKGAVELRTVSLANADAEKSDVLSFNSIDGHYEWHMIKGGRLYVITQFFTGSSRWNSKFEKANLTVVDLRTMEMKATQIDVTLPEDEEDYFYFNVAHTSSGKHELFTIGDDFFRLSGDALVKLTIPQSCQYFFKSEDYRGASLHAVGEEVFAYREFGVVPVDITEEDEENYLSYEMPFYKRLDFEGQSIKCSQSVNTPGRPVMTKSGFMVTSEYTFDPYMEEEFKFSLSESYIENGSTMSLRIKGDELELVDVLHKDISSGLFGEGFITYQSSESRLDFWYLSEQGQFFSRPQYLTGYGEEASMVGVKRFFAGSYIFIQNRHLMDVYEIRGGNRAVKRAVTSHFDRKKTDGSAEAIFDINAIIMSMDQSRFYVSQGLYGLNEVIFQ